jgi:large subunit ribosomal protein L31
MNAAIQPKLNEIQATCACGASYTVLSVSDGLRLDICAACHPFYTGQQRYVDTEGRIEKFKTKFGSASQAIAVDTEGRIEKFKTKFGSASQAIARNKKKKAKAQESAEAPSVPAEKAAE